MGFFWRGVVSQGYVYKVDDGVMGCSIRHRVVFELFWDGFYYSEYVVFVLVGLR